jgi:hypothetical protein
MSDSKFYLKNAEERKKLPLWEEVLISEMERKRDTENNLLHGCVEG